LVWPALVGALLLAIGALTLVGYIRQRFTGLWTPHWVRGVGGFLLMSVSLPAFLVFAGRVENAAAERGVPVLTLAVAIAAQFGLLDEDGSSRRRRR
jgi:hypothetical protein